MVQLTKKERIEQFWNWFNAHKYYYDEVDSVWDNGLDVLSEKINKINQNIKLQALIVNNMHGDNQLIISAGGIIDDFQKVREIVAAAPEMMGWKAVAYIQPHPEVYSMGYKNYRIEPEDLYFMPFLEDEYFNIILYAKNLGKIDQDDSFYMSTNLIMSIIGEYHYATKVSVCLLEDYSEAIEEEYLISSNQLYNFVVNNFMNSN